MELTQEAQCLDFTQKLSAECPCSEGYERYVELRPEDTLIAPTRSGWALRVDVYNEQALGGEGSPEADVVVSMPLSVPSERGFGAPTIDRLRNLCQEQDRGLVVIGSEGFSGGSITKVPSLGFADMTRNFHDALDYVAFKNNKTLDRIVTTGASRGAVISLLAATKEVSEERERVGLPARTIEGIVPVAPVGLRPLSIAKKLRVARQFLAFEPQHIISKTASLHVSEGIEESSNYIRTLIETLPPPAALPAIGKTALLFLMEAPLEGIGQRINRETPIDVLAFNKDGVSTPHYWEQELQEFENATVETLPGPHLNLDCRYAFRRIAHHLIRNVR